jgi:hypothetical protein
MFVCWMKKLFLIVFSFSLYHIKNWAVKDYSEMIFIMRKWKKKTNFGKINIEFAIGYRSGCKKSNLTSFKYSKAIYDDSHSDMCRARSKIVVLKKICDSLQLKEHTILFKQIRKIIFIFFSYKCTKFRLILIFIFFYFPFTLFTAIKIN